MEHYFVTHSSARQKALTDAGVAFTHLAIKGEKGLVFEDRVSANALSAMRLDIERTRQSSYEGIKILYVKRARRNPTGEPAVAAPIPAATAEVVVEAWTHNEARGTDSIFAAVAREFSTVFGVKRIVLKSCRDGLTPERPRVGTGDLNIFFWSSARGQAQSSGVPGNPIIPTHFFGFKYTDEAERWRFWLPSGTGVVIADPAGTKIAELVGENLYILHALDNRDTVKTSQQAIFRKILEEVALIRNFSPEELVKHRAEAARLEKLRLKAEARANPVTIARWDSPESHKQNMIAVAKEFFVPFGSKQIVIHDFSGSYHDARRPIEDERFHIFLSATPGELKDPRRLGENLFGAKLAFSRDSDTSYFTIGEYAGLLEITDEDATHLGGLVGDNLYISVPLVRQYLRLSWDGKSPDALFRRILEEAVFVKTATEKQKAARAREISLRVRARSREEYSKMCGGRIDAEIESAKKVIANSPTKVTEYQQAIVKLIREADRSKELLAEHERFRDRAAEKYVAEFDKLVTIEKVRDVRVADGKVLQVFTDTLYCTDPRTKKVHEIGHFRIEIDPQGRVRWHNLARKVDGYELQMNAPHVYKSGDACLGSIAEIVPDLIAKYEFAALTMVCISFIESVNVEDGAGKNINLWPLAAMQPKK